MDVLAERKLQSECYSALKRRLDALHYCQPLSLDSAMLVEKLLADLVKTTEGFQQLKQGNQVLAKHLAEAKEATNPLEHEIRRLSAQSNELHLELMTSKEQCENKDASWRVSLKKAETENSDLKFLLEKSKDDYKALEKQKGLLKARLDQNLPGNKAKALGLELHKTLLPAHPEAFGDFQHDWANALREADERIRLLIQENDYLKKDQNAGSGDLQRLQQAVAARDIEIERLSEALTAGGPSLQGITVRHEQESQAQALHALQDKLDFLNSENVRLEEANAKNQHSLASAHKLERENKALIEAMAQLNAQNSLFQDRLSHFETLPRGRELHSELHSETQQFQLDKEELLNTMKTLQLEAATHQEELASAQAVKAAYNSDKKAYSEVLEKIENDRRGLQQRLAESEKAQNSLEQQLCAATSQSALQLAQSQGLRKELEQTHQSFSRMNQQSVTTTEESYSLRQELSSLNSQNNILLGEVESLQFELERAKKQRKHTEEQLDGLRQCEFKLRSELDAHAAARQKTVVLLEGAQKELATIKEENAHLCKLRGKDKEALLDLQEKTRGASGEVTAAHHHLRRVQQEHQTLSEELAEKLGELRQRDLLIYTLEQELAELRPLKVKYNSLVDQSKHLQQNTVFTKDNENKLTRQIEYLEEQLRAREDKSRMLTTQLESLKSEKSGFIERIEDLENSLQSSLKSTKDQDAIASETSSLKHQILEQREKERAIFRELEQSKSELRRSQDSSKALERQLARATTQRDAAECELNKLKEHLQTHQTQETISQSGIVKLEERIFHYELENEELKRQMSQEQHQRFRLEDQISSLKSSADSEQQHLARLEDQNAQLKSLIENLEKVREDLLRKLQSSYKDKQADETQLNTLISEITALRAELTGKEEETLSLQNALRNIDQERDYIQNLLDQKTEEFSAIESSLAAYQNNISVLKDKVESLQGKDTTSARRLEERDAQLNKLAGKCGFLQNELEEARAGYASQHRDSQELKEHVIAITKENQYVNEQLMRTAGEKDQLKQYYEEISRTDRLNQEIMRGVEREKEDILLTYRKACEENERLSTSVASMNAEHKSLYAKLQACEQELSNAQSHIAQQETAIFSYQQEINTLERQISSLTHKLEVADQRTQEAKEAKEYYVRDMNTAKHISVGLENNRDEMQRQLASLDNAKLVLDSQLRSAASELSALKSQLEYEKQRYDDLERVLMKEREHLFQAQQAKGAEEDSFGKTRQAYSQKDW